MQTDLKQLLLGTHRGDERAARGLWSAQAPRLTHYARAIVASSADADDVVQAVFCKVLRCSRRELEGVRDPAAWLAQVTRREALNALRGRRREEGRRRAPGGAQVAGTTAGGVDRELEEALGRLPRRLREVIVLRHVAGLTFDQVEAATGVNRNTAAARYKAGVEMLRRVLEPGPAPARVPSMRGREVRHARG